MNKYTTKTFVLFILIFSILFLAGCTSESKKIPDEVFKIITEVKTKYHTDDRTSIFNVKARVDGDDLIITGEILVPEAKSELESRLRKETNYQLSDSLTLLPGAEIGEKKYGIIRISVAQVRKLPNINHEIITQGLMGTKVKILKKAGYWYFVQLEDQYLGWLTKSSIYSGDSNFLDYWGKKSKLIVISNYGQIWKKPSNKCRQPVCDVVNGNTFLNLGLKDGWYHVELPDNRRGFIKSNLVMDLTRFQNQATASETSLINTAQAFLGIPYFWGGKSTKGFDCSGFTQTVYKLNGIKLPRDANMQVKCGEAVEISNSLDNLKPGDLLFFGKNKDRITHVAMYIGKSRFIHAEGLVQINSLNPVDELYSEYRRKTLRAVRRFLKN